MKIAFCTDIYLPQLSGVADSIKLLSGQLKKNGHEVRIYAPGQKGAQAEEEIVRLPSLAVPGSKGDLLFVIPSGMIRDMKRFRPDVIHTHTFSTIGFCALYASWRLGIPLVGTDHTYPAHYLHYIKLNYRPFRFAARKFASWYYNRCIFVTAPGRHLLTELAEYGTVSPMRVISNSIPLNHFRPLDRMLLKKKHGIGGKAVLLFGRIAIEKNLDFAFDIFKKVLAETDADLVVVGDGPHRKDFENRVRKEGIADNVRFFGSLYGEELVEALNTADVCLITSMSDTQSMTMLQAMACELPVVGADAGGIPEYVRDGETGYVIDPHDADSYVEKISELLRNKDKARAFGKAGRQSIMAHFPEYIAKEFEEIYHTAITTP